MTFRVYPLSLIEENKWRAVRYGLDGKLLDLGKQTEVPARELIHELIEWFLRRRASTNWARARRSSTPSRS